jgi:hypothetical protein
MIDRHIRPPLLEAQASKMIDMHPISLDKPHVATLVGVALLGMIFSYKAIVAPFWDYEVYRAAVDCFVGGGDPYSLDAGKLFFVYPPLFLRLFSVFGFPETYGLAIAVMAAVALFAMRDLRAQASFALLGFLTGGGGLIAILTGNFTIIAHLLVIALAHAAYRAEKSTLAPAALALAILLFSALKFYFLAYAAIFLLLPRRRALLFLALPAGVVLVTLAQMALDHELWAAFSAALYRQTLANGDLGFTLFGIVERRYGLLLGGLALHEGVALAMIALAVGLRWRAGARAPNIRSQSELFYVLAALILVNPRLKDYDFAAFMVCVYLSVALSERRSPLIDGFFAFVLPITAAVAAVVLNVGPALGLPITAPYASVYFFASYGSFFLLSVRSWPGLAASAGPRGESLAHM